jgi:hypothetical protein
LLGLTCGVAFVIKALSETSDFFSRMGCACPIAIAIRNPQKQMIILTPSTLVASVQCGSLNLELSSVAAVCDRRTLKWRTLPEKKECDGHRPPQMVLPRREDAITPAQCRTVQEWIEALAENTTRMPGDKAFGMWWSRFKKRFGLNRYEEFEASEFGNREKLVSTAAGDSHTRIRTRLLTHGAMRGMPLSSSNASSWRIE